MRNKKLVLGKREDYTDEQWEAIPAARLALREAEQLRCWHSREWKRVLNLPPATTRDELTPYQAYRIVQKVRYDRLLAYRSVRAAQKAYLDAVLRPPALKEFGRLAAGYLKERLNAPSFADRLFPVVDEPGPAIIGGFDQYGTYHEEVVQLPSYPQGGAPQQPIMPQMYARGPAGTDLEAAWNAPKPSTLKLVDRSEYPRGPVTSFLQFANVLHVRTDGQRTVFVGTLVSGETAVETVLSDSTGVLSRSIQITPKSTEEE